MTDQTGAVPLRERQELLARQASKTAVLVRMADIMQRIDRLAEQMEKAADDVERQLSAIKGRL